MRGMPPVAPSWKGEWVEATVHRFWEARTQGDERLMGSLACEISDEVLNFLTRRAKTSLPNRGLDLVEEVHFKIMEALLDPGSADGQALGQHFYPRVYNRYLDALRRYERRKDIELPPLVDGDDGSEIEREDRSAGEAYASVEVAQALSRIRDERKRVAFIMHMLNEPRAEIAAMLDIDVKTLFRWIKEVREYLKKELNL